jgi:hypothetical protein
MYDFLLFVFSIFTIKNNPQQKKIGVAQLMQETRTDGS